MTNITDSNNDIVIYKSNNEKVLFDVNVMTFS